MLRKKSSGSAGRAKLASALNTSAPAAVDRRTFLRNSGLTVGGLAAVATLAPGRVQKAEAAGAAAGAKLETRKSVCTHCSVGCTVIAEVSERRLGRAGARLGQPVQPGRPLRQGRGGARARPRRAPPEVPDEAGGRQMEAHQLGADAINEIGDKMLKIRESGPDSVYWLGSAKHNNEQAYLFRKFAPSGAPTTSTTRRGSVTRPRSRVLRTPGATAR
jgi:formate dehydrogenase major subunit